MIQGLLKFIRNIGSTTVAYPYHVLGPILVLILALAVARTPLMQTLENQTVNWRFQFRAAMGDPPADARLLLLTIDEASLRDLGQWPWPRWHHGKLMKLMSNYAMPRVLAWDILFTEKAPLTLRRQQELEAQGKDPKDVYADEDVYMVDGAQWLPAVITGAIMDKQGVLRAQYSARSEAGNLNYGMTVPVPVAKISGNISQITGTPSALLPIDNIRDISAFGFVDSEPDYFDGIRRTLPLLVRIHDEVFLSLTAQTLAMHTEIVPESVEVRLGEYLKIDEYKIPINEKGEMLVNYRAEETFQQVGYADLYRHLIRTHESEVKEFGTYAFDKDGNRDDSRPIPSPADKIVLVGQYAAGLTDLGPNPLTGRSPLVLTHLNALNNILRNDFLRVAPLHYTMLGWVLVTGVSLFGLREAAIRYAVGLPVLLVAVYIVFAFWLFWAHSLQIDLLGPVAAFALLHFGSVIMRWSSEERSKQQVKQIFSAYVSPQVMNQVLDESKELQLGGQTRPATVMFSDIRSFTTISEGLEPQELVSQLNEYFEKMVKQVTDNRGTLHKFIGDAIMAAWGDVVSEGPQQDAIRAVRAAVGMRKALADLNQLRQERGMIPWRIGIGLNHGKVMVGHLGAMQRMEFTLIGDAVNLASRLEGLNKEFGTDIVIGETLNDLLGPEFLTRPLGLIKVVGKTRPVMVYEVMADFQDPVSTADTGYARMFSNALEAFLSRHFEKAHELFHECVETRHSDHTANKYLLNTKNFLKEPPDDYWDGVVEMKRK